MPVPLVHTQLYPLLGRAVLEATRLGVFEQCGPGVFSVDDLAGKTGLPPKPLSALIELLAAAGYFNRKGDGFKATAMCRRYCLPASRDALTDQQMFNARVIGPWTERLGDLLTTGHGVDQHHTLDTEGWSLYQAGMANFPRQALAWVIGRIPAPKQGSLLDLGGGPGLMANALKTKYPALDVEVMDLPEAIAAQGDKRPEGINYHAGNVLTDELGTGRYDCILASNLVHHFHKEDAALLAAKVKAALNPGGRFVVLDFFRPPRPDFITAATHLFFQLTSSAGVPSSDEMKTCLREAGFADVRFRRFQLLPGFGMVAGIANS